MRDARRGACRGRFDVITASRFDTLTLQRFDALTDPK